MNVPRLPKIPRLGAPGNGSPPRPGVPEGPNGFAETLVRAIATDRPDTRIPGTAGSTAPVGPGRRLAAPQHETAGAGGEAPRRADHAGDLAPAIGRQLDAHAADPAPCADAAPRAPRPVLLPEQGQPSGNTASTEGRHASRAGATEEERRAEDASGAADGVTAATRLLAQLHAAAGAEGQPPRVPTRVISRSTPMATAALRASAEGTSPATLATRRTEPRPVAARRDVPRPADAAPVADGAATPRPALPIGPSFAEPRTAPGTTAAPATPPVAQLPPAPAGVEIGGALLRSAAHLKVDAGALGAVDLHLRVRDGALHLRVDGDAAHLLEARSGELTRALAGEGLKLGSIELPHPDGSALQGQAGGDERQGRRDGWQEAANAREAAESAPRTPPPGPKARTRRGSSIDVQA